MSTKVTIQDIADALGISRNTVSKAINNSEGLADATRERILAKAVEMGYKHFSYIQTMADYGFENRHLSAVIPGSAGEVALLTGSPLGGSHFAVTLLDRLKRELAQFGYTLGFYHVSAEDLRRRRLPHPLPNENTRAMVCFEMFDWDYDEMLADLDIPVLFADGPSKHCGRSLNADQLYMDSTTELTRLLHLAMDGGIRRFGFIGDIDHCQSFFERYMAFRGTMMLDDVPVDKRHLIFSNKSDEILKQLSGLKELPELFLCANDYIAIDVINSLKKLGKSVPEDVMICGFDDSAESRFMTPPLTTIHIHTQSMAFAAAFLLLTRIKEPSLDNRVIYIQTELKLRDSTVIPDGGGVS